MSRSSRFLHLIATLQALTLASCDQPALPADAGTDSGPPPNCDALAPFATGDTEGHAEPLGAPAGQSRAGRLAASALPVDRTGLATWEEGDFVLANDRIALIVEDAGESDLYDPFGGRPVGIARVEGGALVDAGDFNEVILGFGAFLVESESVTVMNDGSDGEAAVVRAVGPLGELEFAGELLTTLVPGDYGGLPAALDYTMEPGSDAIDIHLEVQVPTPEAVGARMLVTAFFQRYRMPRWLEGSGFDSATGAQPMALFVDDVGASYAWVAGEDRELTQVLDVSGVLAYSQGRALARGCESTRFHVGTIVVGGPGLPGLQSALARHRGESLRTITGSVTESDGTTPATGVRVHVRRADGSHFARLTPAADGTFSVEVPEENVSFFAFREGMALVGPVEVAASESTVAIAMDAFSTIVVNVTDGDDPATDDFIPARVQIVPSADPPAIPADLGELVHRDGRAHVAFSTTGNVELRVDPGLYEIIVSRGYEYEIVREGADVSTPGTTATLDAELQRVVDTTGVMCADYHIHTHRSPDSPDSPELKLMGLIADGLEIAIRSDHEWVNDFQPVIESMGLERYAFGIGGEELTTFAWGHFGVFPLTPNPSQVNAGAVPWVGRLPPAVFDEARDRPEAPALIINHPRGAAIGGYFAAAAYNPATNTAGNQEYWDEEFTLVEVFNDGDFEEFRDNVVADWFGLLNGGRRVFAVGSSDSHGIWGSPVGYPRTCLDLGADDPSDRTLVTPEAVRDATEAGHSTISGGLYLTVVGPDGAGPGDEVSGAGATAMFDVTVQGACWMRATELEVIVDGVTVETIEIPVVAPAECDPVRLSATGATAIGVPVAAEGSWVVFHASGDMDLSPVHPGRNPFAVSNPVFLRR